VLVHRSDQSQLGADSSEIGVAKILDITAVPVDYWIDLSDYGIAVNPPIPSGLQVTAHQTCVGSDDGYRCSG
jgi:hypothetical protein